MNDFGVFNIKDTIAERTFLMEKCFPELRMCCAERGFDLEIYDLHWGMKDESTDDHVLPELSMKLLESSINSDKGINCLVCGLIRLTQYNTS